MFKQVPQRLVLSRDIVGSVSVPFSRSLKRKRDKLARQEWMQVWLWWRECCVVCE